MISLINFTKLSLEEKKLVLSWRNHPNIRKWMYNTSEILLEDHLKYIDLLSSKKDRLYFLVLKNNHPIGVADLTTINKEEQTAEIGLYADPHQKCNGSFILKVLIEYAFDTLNLHKLYANVYDTNIKAINLYNKFNFKEKKREKNLIFMELKNVHRKS
ncbi:MAG: UDP-4-amino-4,6-dideoxy-N-acetyl-beta-L-altrosamine N-acetyltransferase [Campylobacterales bacterium]|nr:UDP-4-amino-4,6-dideoxy-N-acetyl-beta-L-altrosamine N-acetyltransferase [Campylobacterales bacterium]